MFKKWATDETDLSYEHGYLAPIEGKIPRFLAWIGMIAGLAPKKKVTHCCMTFSFYVELL